MKIEINTFLRERLKQAAFDYGYHRAAWNERKDNKDKENEKFSEGQGSILSELIEDKKFHDYLQTEEGNEQYNSGMIKFKKG